MKFDSPSKTRTPLSVKDFLFHSVFPSIVKRATFADRLAYALLLHYWRRGSDLTQKALAEAVERAGPTVAEWYDREEPPKDWQVHAPMARALDVPESWLVRGEGDPPRPHLWEEWLKERRAVQQVAALVKGGARPMTAGAAEPEARPSAAKPSKRDRKKAS